tara:strand:+ start:540 stop:1097 length:558 start_codon:yes stop_codon:yes gene_type:complete
MSIFDKQDLERRMQGALDALHKEFSGLRTGRASIALLEPLMVDAYGSMMPITQVGTLGMPDARTLSVQVWDKTMVKSVEKAIRESSLGLNPSVDGQIVRVPMPELSTERRQELTKVAAKYAEQARVAIRNVRRDGMDSLKQMEKEGDISEDEQRRSSTEIQTLTDSFVKKVDEALSQKDKDILQV